MVCETGTPELTTETDQQSELEWGHLSSKKTIKLSFCDLSYTVKSGFGRGSCQVLHNINGDLLPGELTAIMGPSGAGKSSLMNILAGYITRGVTGSIYVNEEERELKNFFQHSCYIMQDEKLQPLLTVREAMHMAAQLKLGEKNQEQVRKILEVLGLSDSANTQTHLLSGGQRKRLAIALELINNPPIMFFDEPTSGLDSSSSWQCVSLLKKLASGGRTVVCTIHQPSALLFEQFDKLYAITNGRCMYHGKIVDLVPILAKHNFNCPEYHNPADFLLEVLVGEHGSIESLENHNNQVEEKRVAAYENKCHAPGKKETKVQSMESTLSCTTDDYHTPFMLQFSVLIKRNYKIHLRDKFLSQLRILMHLFIGAVIGLLYYDIGNDAAYIRDNFGFLYFCIMFIQFTAFSSKIMSYPVEFPILLREYFNGWYSLKPYFLASMAADAPVQVMCTLCYTLVAYYLTSQPMEIYRIFLFFIIILLVGLISQLIGILIGLTMGMQNGMVFGPLAILPFLIFSGFFVSMKDASVYFEWLFHISYLKYGLEAVMQAMYSYNREKLPCCIEYCHYKMPVKFLEEIGMVDAKYFWDVVFLTVLYFTLLAVTYGVLKLKLNWR